jgi:hypothetical protein
MPIEALDMRTTSSSFYEIGDLLARVDEQGCEFYPME